MPVLLLGTTSVAHNNGQHLGEFKIADNVPHRIFYFQRPCPRNNVLSALGSVAHESVMEMAGWTGSKASIVSQQYERGATPKRELSSMRRNQGVFMHAMSAHFQPNYSNAPPNQQD
jgi:hypothetical protein